MQRGNPWPSILGIAFPKGIAITLFTIVEGFILWQIIFFKVTNQGMFTPLQSDLINLILTILNLIFLLFIFIKIGNIPLWNLVVHQIPNTKIFLQWIYIALGLSLFNFIIRFPYGLDAQFSHFVPRHLIILITSAILAPIKEEIIFRGILFGSLRPRFGQLYAFLFSISIFVFAHSKIQLLIWQGNWDHFFYFFLVMSIIAFLLTYIYESTRSLLLCIIFHSIHNSVYHLAPLVGFFYGGYIVNGP